MKMSTSDKGTTSSPGARHRLSSGRQMGGVRPGELRGSTSLSAFRCVVLASTEREHRYA